MTSLIFRRCSGMDPQFQENCRLLDAELEKRMGTEVQKDYLQYNHVYDQIPYAVVAEKDGKVCGSGALKPYDEGILEMKRVFVYPEEQGQGIGTAIVEELLQWARETGCREIILESGVPLVEAHHIYEKVGFVRIANFGPFEGMINSFCYAKRLEQ